MMAQIMNQVFTAAQAGPLMEAQIYPLNNTGRLRVTYNWLYSALNCDPADPSDFVWVFHKINESQIALSPRDGYGGMTLYASVRPDWSYYVQVQAPNSADWITAAGGDEYLGLQSHGLLFVSFTGLNGQYIAVDPTPSSGAISTGGSHAGYKVRSDAGSLVEEARWFLAIERALQDSAQALVALRPSEQQIREAVLSNGWQTSDETISRVLETTDPSS